MPGLQASHWVFQGIIDGWLTGCWVLPAVSTAQVLSHNSLLHLDVWDAVHMQEPLNKHQGKQGHCRSCQTCWACIPPGLGFQDLQGSLLFLSLKASGSWTLGQKSGRLTLVQVSEGEPPTPSCSIYAMVGKLGQYTKPQSRNKKRIPPLRGQDKGPRIILLGRSRESGPTQPNRNSKDMKRLERDVGSFICERTAVLVGHLNHNGAVLF